MNNRNFFLIVFLLLHHLYSIAQRFNAGVEIGFVGSDVYGSDIVADSDAWNNTAFRKLGLMIGGSVNTALGNRTLLQMEINYIQKGTQQAGDSNGYGFYKFAFDYIEVPFLIRYRRRFNRGERTIKGFEMNGGVSAGKLIRSKAQGSNFYSVNDFSYLNRTDISLLAGFAFNLNDHFDLSFRYSNSVIPVFKRLNSPMFFAQSLNVGNNMVLHFIVQYTFGVKHALANEEETN